MRRCNINLAAAFLLAAAAVQPHPARAEDLAVPIATDSRIKTFIYNENDVFSLMTHYGYQANVEFGPKEIIETVSVGDRVAFQIIPAGRRLFIRPMEEDARTNMTVITNLHAYQFDLKSTASTKTSKEELVYVARFFYPGDSQAGAPQVHAHQPPPLPEPAAAPPPQAYGEYGEAQAYAGDREEYGGNPGSGRQEQQGYNFMYSVTGPDTLAPIRMYDDGRSTYLSFRQPDGFAPRLFEVTGGGREVPLPYRMADGMLIVDKVLPRLTIRHNNEYVCVYNDALVPMEMTQKR